MFRIIKLAMVRALAELLIRFGVWFGKLFGPAILAVSLFAGVLLFSRYKLLQVWPHPTALHRIGVAASCIPALAILLLTSALFVMSVRVKPAPKQTAALLDYGLDNGVIEPARMAEVIEFRTTDDMEESEVEPDGYAAE